MEYADFAEAVLNQAGGPMHYKEITEQAMPQLKEMWRRKNTKTEPKTPWNTMRVRLTADARFAAQGAGLFDLANRTGAAEAAPKPVEKPEPVADEVEVPAAPEPAVAETPDPAVAEATEPAPDMLAVLDSVSDRKRCGAIGSVRVRQQADRIVVTYIEAETAVQETLLRTDGFSAEQIAEAIDTAADIIGTPRPDQRAGREAKVRLDELRRVLIAADTAGLAPEEVVDARIAGRSFAEIQQGTL